MDRLQKKCFIVSAGLHLLLVLILVVGPAFLSSKSEVPEMQILDFIPRRTVDAMVSGGGDPKGSIPKPTPVVQAQPQAQPDPPPAAPPPRPEVREPDPPKEPAKSESLEASDQPKRKVEISKTLVTRKNDTQAEAKKRAEAQAREETKQWADARRHAADAIGRTANHISAEIAGGGSLNLDFGPGGGGVPYANFNQAVMSVYKRAWSGTVPNDATDETVAAEASVTIARNGDVISARIVRSSGRAGVDRSVQSVLDRVKYAAPLPEEAKEDQRTVTITFEVKAKKGVG